MGIMGSMPSEGQSPSESVSEAVATTEPTQVTEGGTTPEPTEASSQEGSPSPTMTPDSAQVPPPYQPNFKYKVLHEEKEFPKEIHEFIKDKEKEEFFRTLFAKSGAADHFKTRNREIYEELNGTKEELSQFKEDVQELYQFYQGGDLDSFFEKLGVSEEKVLQWAINKGKYYQMDPEQRSMIDAKRQAERQAYTQTKQTSLEVQQYRDAIVKMKQREVENTLSHPEIQEYAAEFDRRANRPGAFVRELVRRGKEAYDQGEDLSAEEVARDIMNFWKLELSSKAPAQPPNQVGPTGVPQKKEPQVLPNLGGSKGTTMEPKFKNLDDVLEYRKKKYGG